MGLGCGGHSRLGLATGKGEDNAVAVVRRALDLGINFIDTAEGYGTEPAVARGIEGVPRDHVVISTKVSPKTRAGRRTPAELREHAEGCLSRLRTDHVDVLHLHGVGAADYDYARDELLPVVRKLRDEGKVRFAGITEAFGSDPQHHMLSRAVREDDAWGVVMVGFNLLNPSARARVLPHTRAKGIGTLDMFAVRRALSRPETLAAVMDDLVSRGAVDPAAFDRADPLGFLLTGEGAASDLPDAAYRFCRHEPGIDVVLVGTGSVEHLEENARSILRPPLRPGDRAKLEALFGAIDFISGN
jgi:aryl-alcohol dehydrogenase-like predicted oxidoreductase